MSRCTPSHDLNWGKHIRELSQTCLVMQVVKDRRTRYTRSNLQDDVSNSDGCKDGDFFKLNAKSAVSTCIMS